MIGDNESNFPDQLLLFNRQVANLRKTVGNYLSADVKLPKLNYLRWYNQEDLLKTFLKTGLLLIKNVIKLIPLGLTAAASAADAEIHKKILGLGHNNTTTLIISNNEMKDIIKIVNSLEDSGSWKRNKYNSKR